jgi:hypothetical protein
MLARSLLLLLLAAPAFAEDTPPVDIAAIKEKLKVVSDGKGHFVAIEPFELGENFFYGDGKTFYKVRVRGGGRNGNESFSRNFWEPRVNRGAEAEFGFRDNKWTMTCANRETELKPVSDAENKKILDTAKFLGVLWKRQAYALARDNLGNYFYVDRAREPEGNKNFRLFAGPKGSMKLQKMTNVVSDSGGDIFATKTGELRLVLNRGDNKGDNQWIAGKTAPRKLVLLPVEDNVVVIYSELGVYTGQKLGTPCDDL